MSDGAPPCKNLGVAKHIKGKHIFRHRDIVCPDDPSRHISSLCGAARLQSSGLRAEDIKCQPYHAATMIHSWQLVGRCLEDAVPRFQRRNLRYRNAETPPSATGSWRGLVDVGLSFSSAATAKACNGPICRLIAFRCLQHGCCLRPSSTLRTPGFIRTLILATIETKTARSWTAEVGLVCSNKQMPRFLCLRRGRIVELNQSSIGILLPPAPDTAMCPGDIIRPSIHLRHPVHKDLQYM